MAAGRLKEVAGVFLRLGATAFGGPAAHIALFEDEFVHRRGWLTQAEFLDLLGATNLIPGPNSTEMAIHLGYRRAGWWGLIVAGLGFTLPAALIVGVLAWAYTRWGALPALMGVLIAVKPVVLVVVLQALVRLARTAVKNQRTAGLAVASLAAAWMGVNEVAVLAGAGVLAGAIGAVHRAGGLKCLAAPLLVPTALLGATSGGGVAVSFGLLALFLFFLKVGAVLYGSGYVLLAFLQGDLVERWGWLTETQLMDAVAVGQVTPGPLFTTATFIGYLLGGWSGAGVATLGIFLPSFLFVALSGPLIPRLRRSAVAGAVLDGVNAASWALMLHVLLQLSATAVTGAGTGLLAVAAAILLLGCRVGSSAVLAGAALIGLIAGWCGAS